MTTPNDDYNGLYHERHVSVNPEQQALPDDVRLLKELVARYAQGYERASERVKALELENKTFLSQKQASNMKTTEKLVTGNVKIQGDFLQWKSAAEQEISILQDHISTQSETLLHLKQELDHYKVAVETQAKTIAELLEEREKHSTTITELLEERERICSDNEELKRRLDEATGKESWSMLESFLQENAP
jgi:chromosome segregation ATPase